MYISCVPEIKAAVRSSIRSWDRACHSPHPSFASSFSFFVFRVTGTWTVPPGGWAVGRIKMMEENGIGMYARSAKSGRKSRGRIAGIRVVDHRLSSFYDESSLVCLFYSSLFSFSLAFFLLRPHRHRWLLPRFFYPVFLSTPVPILFLRPRYRCPYGERARARLHRRWPRYSPKRKRRERKWPRQTRTKAPGGGVFERVAKGICNSSAVSSSSKKKSTRHKRASTCSRWEKRGENEETTET